MKIINSMNCSTVLAMAGLNQANIFVAQVLTHFPGGSCTPAPAVFVGSVSRRIMTLNGKRHLLFSDITWNDLPFVCFGSTDSVLCLCELDR